MVERNKQLETEMDEDNNKILYRAAVWAAMGIGGAVLGPFLYNYLTHDINEDISPADNISPSETPIFSKGHSLIIEK